MSAATDQAAGREAAVDALREKPMTIGAVCKALVQEFPDISISKIRYLEDQKLLTPQRTPGGYRLYTKADVTRLRAILRLQRDEFLPLRVIRQELASGGSEAAGSDGAAASTVEAARARRRPAVTAPASAAQYRVEEIIAETRASPKLVAELEEFGLIKGQRSDGTVWYDDAERDIIIAVVELAPYGVRGRNLKVFKTSADREAALIQQILEPALRSRNSERRREAVDALENLAAVTTHLKHLLLVRDLRKLVS